MAASSPALNSETATTATASLPTIPKTTAAATAAPLPPKPLSAVIAAANLQHLSDTPTKTQRGHNKPKCVKCGNVARSRCPYYSCKSCCSKDQNPCHIHVLKGNANIPEKTASTSAPLHDQLSTEVPPAGISHRVSSIRQLSNPFAQFNNVQSPARSRKPLTRKDAAIINEWRFSKLKECKDRNIENEEEAFNRYMRNVGLLEEIFSVKSEGPSEDKFLASTTFTSSAEEMPGIVWAMKLRLRSGPTRTTSCRKNIQEEVMKALSEVNKYVVNSEANCIDDRDVISENKGRVKRRRSERNPPLKDLIDKLNKARNEEDLKSCMKMKLDIFSDNRGTGQDKGEDVMSQKQTQKNDLVPSQQLQYSPPKMLRTIDTEESILNSVDMHFSSLENIEYL